MVFTREDILKIQNALLQLGRKDSEFKDANTPLNSDDYIAILQDGINKKVSINNLLSTLGLLKKDDFINVSDKYDEYYIHLSEAITIIANNKRKKGLVITFLDIEGNWRIYLFIGELSNFIITDYWKDLHDFKYPIINTVLPDEEDLTLTYPNIEGNSFIKLKDKEYNLDNFSGLGKVILRKNIVEVEDPTYGKIKKNILYQDMINKSNTIYVIQYDFTLGENITIPENCILEFDGGSLSNGILKGTNTSIINALKSFNSIVFSGTWNVTIINSNFFEDAERENAITNLFKLCNPDMYNHVIIDKGIYCLSAKNEYDYLISIPNNTDVELIGTLALLPNSYGSYSIFDIRNVSNVRIYGGGSVIGDLDSHTGTTGEWGMGISIVGSSDIEINGLNISKCWGDSIYVGGSKEDSPNTNIKISGCELHHSRRQGISVTNVSKCFISSCNIHDIEGTDPGACIDVEPNASCSTTDIYITDCIFRDSWYGVEFWGQKSTDTIIKNCLVKNCIFYDNGKRVAGASIAIGHTGADVLIEGCKIDSPEYEDPDNGTPALRLVINRPECKVTVKNNNIIAADNPIIMQGQQSYLALIENDIKTTDTSFALISLTQRRPIYLVSELVIKNNTISTKVKFDYLKNTLIEDNIFNNNITVSDSVGLRFSNNIVKSNLNTIRGNKMFISHNLFEKYFWAFSASEATIDSNTFYSFNTIDITKTKLYRNTVIQDSLQDHPKTIITANNCIIDSNSFEFSTNIKGTDGVNIIKNNTFNGNKREICSFEGDCRYYIENNIFNDLTEEGETSINDMVLLNCNGSKFSDNIVNIKYSNQYAIRIGSGTSNNSFIGNVVNDPHNVNNRELHPIGANYARNINKSVYGSTDNRPVFPNIDTYYNAQDIGHPYFDTTLGMALWWNGYSWQDSHGFAAIPQIGTTEQRPTNSLSEGFEYYDTSLKKKILWNGTKWVNIDGSDL